MANKRNLLLLFERPQEPVLVGKGENNNVFDVPSEYLTDRFRQIGEEIQSRFSEFAGEIIPVRADVKIPNLELPLTLGRHEQFSLFIPRHRRLAGRLIDIFMSKFSTQFIRFFFCSESNNSFCVVIFRCEKY